MKLEIRELEAADREWVRAFLIKHWGSARVVSRGRLHQADELPGLLAEAAGSPAGLLLYHVQAGQCEVVVLQADPPGRGVGAQLLAAARAQARQLGCARLWLITTNDNEPAQRFYARQGMRPAAVHRGAVAAARRLKPEIPWLGVGGRPIEDEIEFEYGLTDDP